MLFFHILHEFVNIQNVDISNLDLNIDRVDTLRRLPALDSFLVSGCFFDVNGLSTLGVINTKAFTCDVYTTRYLHWDETRIE